MPAPDPPGISVVVNTYNHAATVRRALGGVLTQQLGGRPHEIIVVDDGSTDGTRPITADLAASNPGHEWRIVHLDHAGGVACRQHGIDLAQHELVLLLGGDFILCDPHVMAHMCEQLDPGAPFVSLYGPHGGMGTLYRRASIQAVGGFDLAFNRFGSGFRDDSDLHYRLQDAGQTGRHLPHLRDSYQHQQPRPPGLRGALAYAAHRVAVHQLDPLLFRRHPERFARDYPLLAGWIVHPAGDFNRATGRWRPGGPFGLSSPQGVVLLPGDTPLRRAVVIAAGLAYVVAVNAARLRGAITYRVALV